MGRKPKYATLSKYQPYIDIIMDELGLTGKVKLEWVFGSWATMGGDAILYTPISNAGVRWGLVRINKTATHNYILQTIMHELKHIQQYFLNKLSPSYTVRIITNRGSVKHVWKTKWMDVEYDFYTTSKNPQMTLKYMSQPWEIEAYAYQTTVKRLFPNNKLPDSKKYIGRIDNIKFYKVKR